jgi:hypothetical protein
MEPPPIGSRLERLAENAADVAWKKILPAAKSDMNFAPEGWKKERAGTILIL